MEIICKKLADYENAQIIIKRNILISQIQKNYNIIKDDAEKLVKAWEKTHDPRLILGFIL